MHKKVFTNTKICDTIEVLTINKKGQKPMDYQAIQLIEISKQLKRIADSLEGLTNVLQED